MSKFYEKAKSFAVEHILPYSKEVDEKLEFPVETFKELGKAGYFKLMIPEELGGLGKGMVEHSEACRAFSESCATAGLCYMMHNVALMCVLNFGSEELKKKICEDVVNNNKFLALAYSEFGTGTHFYISDLKADFNGDKVTFNGVKSMVTSAGQAGYYLVLAPSDVEGIDNWVFPADSNGITFEQANWKGLGMRGNVSCPMRIEDVVLDKSMRIGNAGSGADQVFGVVAPYFITGLASVYSGVCQNILSEAMAHSTNRKYPDGKSLSEIETVQIHLSKIYTQTNSAVLATNEAARAFEAGEADALAKILSARIFASESAIELARIGMRIVGGKGYNGEGAMERLLRDAYAGQIMAPSVDVLIVWLGKAITGQPLL